MVIFPVSQIAQQITVQSPCITYLNSNTYNITYHERDAQSRNVRLRHIEPTKICTWALHLTAGTVRMAEKLASEFILDFTD